MNVNLVLCKKRGVFRSFHLPSPVTIVGRRQDCDMCVPLMVVSRRHCELHTDEGQLWIRDLGSRNGTFVNEERTENRQINPGDQIRIGPLRFIVQIEGEPADIATMNPPISEEHEAAEEKPVDKHAAEFANLEDLDLTQDHNTNEILDILSQEMQ